MNIFRKNKIVQMDYENKQDKILVILSVNKFIFSFILTLFAYTTTKNIEYCLVGTCEIIIVFTITNIIVRKHKRIAIIINSILLLLYNIQMAVLYFGNSFVSMIMLTNIDSLQDLSGKAVIYGMAVLFVMLFSFLPICEVKLNQKYLKDNNILSALLAIELCLTMIIGNSYSPFYNLCLLGFQGYKLFRTTNEIANDENEYLQLFYKSDITNFYPKQESLPENVNVILIMTEGLSQNIVEDERNIMPNLSKLEKESLYFSNYYNHTFATYRGIIGQLYSGYQLNNLDSNNLISIQSILSDSGYSTAFINTEPSNGEFTGYLTSMGFDEVLGSPSSELNGLGYSISDKDAYAMLFDTAENFENNSDRPFFLAMYTFGTHASFYSIDEEYGDGSNDYLNKFYNVDFWLGDFLEKFNQSELSDDTLLIFTSDHCTYADNDFVANYPEYSSNRVNSMVDEIPLLFYYKGITAEECSVNGRNSLDLAPTILDYLDITAPNYFLGMSLFGSNEENHNDFDTTFYIDEESFYDTDDGNVCAYTDEVKVVLENLITKYFSISTKVVSE